MAKVELINTNARDIKETQGAEYTRRQITLKVQHIKTKIEVSSLFRFYFAAINLHLYSGYLHRS